MASLYAVDLDIIVASDIECLTGFKDKTILLIGATGNILSYIARLLFEMNDRFGLNAHICLHGRSIERLRSRFIDCIDRPDLEFLCFNIESEFPMDRRFDYMIHGASPASARFFKETPVDVIIPNVFGMRNILEYQKCSNGRGSHSVFLSSQAVYGNVDLKEITENDYGIIDPLAERSCYVEAKRMTEQLCAAYAKQYGVVSSVVRVPYAYGPSYDLDHDSRALPRFIKKIINEETFEMSEDDQIIQYTYAGDVANGIFHVLYKGKPMPDGVYNIGGDDFLRFQDMVQTMVEIANNGAKMILTKDNFALKGNKELDYTRNSTEKLKELGWKPCFGYKEGLKQTISAFL